MAKSENFNEKELLQLLQQGDRSAMKALYSLNVGYLSAVCSRYVIDEDDVKDILQECFIKIFTSISNFQYHGEGSLRAWMTRIVVNESLKFLQRNKLQSAVIAEENIPDIVDDDTDQSPDVADISATEIQELIRLLPTGYRTIFNLYVLEDKSHAEIASLLGITESTSASQLHRAKNMLAKMINEIKEK